MKQVTQPVQTPEFDILNNAEVSFAHKDGGTLALPNRSIRVSLAVSVVGLDTYPEMSYWTFDSDCPLDCGPAVSVCLYVTDRDGDTHTTRTLLGTREFLRLLFRGLGQCPTEEDDREPFPGMDPPPPITKRICLVEELPDADFPASFAYEAFSLRFLCARTGEVNTHLIPIDFYRGAHLATRLRMEMLFYEEEAPVADLSERPGTVDPALLLTYRGIRGLPATDGCAPSETIILKTSPEALLWHSRLVPSTGFTWHGDRPQWLRTFAPQPIVFERADREGTPQQDVVYDASPA